MINVAGSCPSNTSPINSDESQSMKDNILKELSDRNIISIEGLGMITESDVLSAISIVDELNKGRNIAAELEHIKKLQRERDAIN